MDFWSIFNEVKETFMQSDVSDYRGHLALQVNMTGEGEGKFYAELSDGVLKVEPYEYFERFLKAYSRQAWPYFRIYNR